MAGVFEYTTSMIGNGFHMELLTATSVEETLQMLLEPEAWKYIAPGQGKTESQHRDFLFLKLNEIETQRGYYWLVREQGTNALIGGINVTPIPDTEDIQIGWMIRNSFQRRGFAFKAAELAMKYVLKETDIEMLYAVYDSENIASEKIIQRLGFYFDRSFQEGERTINVFSYNCSQTR